MRERRRDPMTGEWRIFSAARMDRTFLPPASECPLCPTAPGGPETEVPDPSFDVVVFDNRFPALSADAPVPTTPSGQLYAVEPAVGAAEVVLYTDVHDASFPQLDRDRVELLVDVWADRYDELSRRSEVAYVLVFENRGEVLGVTLHHPHGQIYGFPEIPPAPARELAQARLYHAEHDACVLCDVVARELTEGVRIVARTRSFVAFVPFAARFPYEVHVATLRHATSLLELTQPERASLAELLLEVTRAYDGLFGFPLPYVMAIHQEPCDGDDWRDVSHLHLEFMPLHRSAGKLKYLAGAELGGGAFVNDAMPETTAAALRGALRDA